MAHHYFPHTAEDIRAMLDVCGVKSLNDLYADIPDEIRLKKEYDLPDSLSEKEIRDFFHNLASKNRKLACFAGAGYYDHYTPAAVATVLNRSEYLTAYTPYQPEISQGTLQYIFEYQSMITALTGMEVSNASMYDGTTATAEAMMMAVAASRKRNRVLVSATVNPAVRKVVETYGRYHRVKIDLIEENNGVTSLEDLDKKLAERDVAGVIVAPQNFYGIAEDLTGWADKIHAAKALLIVSCIASNLAVLKTPGEWGADIATGDAQSLGMPLSYGGPYLGFLCATKALIRKMPGRITGATKDADGRRVFVLTLQAREQHIRRDKATSNICSNQGLMALHTIVYLSLLGPKGLREVAEEGINGAHYLASELTKTGKMNLTYEDKPFVNEFLMTCSFDPDILIRKGIDAGILAGMKIADDKILIAVTEMQTRGEMEKLVELVKSL